MTDRVEYEVESLRAHYHEVELSSDGTWVKFPQWQLPKGWACGETRLLVLIPAGYPVTAPDNFYTDPNLRLSDGRKPSNTSLGPTHDDQEWLQFSYHIESGDWQSHAETEKGHNLATFMDGVARRLMELN